MNEYIGLGLYIIVGIILTFVLIRLLGGKPYKTKFAKAEQGVENE